MKTQLSKEDLLPFASIPPLVFETERLRLRALVSGEAKLIFDLYASDPVATKFMSFKCTGRIQDTEAFVESVAARFRGERSSLNVYAWVLELKGSGVPIGSTGIGPVNKFTASGGYILNPKFWGYGYASEAWDAVVNWAKTQPEVCRIEAVHDVENRASGKVMLAAGMVYEGVLRRHSVLPNLGEEPRDVAMYAWARD